MDTDTVDNTDSVTSVRGLLMLNPRLILMLLLMLSQRLMPTQLLQLNQKLRLMPMLMLGMDTMAITLDTALATVPDMAITMVDMDTPMLDMDIVTSARGPLMLNPRLMPLLMLGMDTMAMDTVMVVT